MSWIPERMKANEVSFTITSRFIFGRHITEQGEGSQAQHIGLTKLRGEFTVQEG